MTETTKSRLPNRLIGSSGRGARRSHHTKPVSRAIAASPVDSVPMLTPASGRSITVSTSAMSPADESMAPRMSSLGRLASSDSGTTSSVATIAASASGGFTQKIACQLKCSRSNPPMIGPIATPTPATAAQTPMAFARSRGSANTWTRIDSVDGMMNAAPTPITARQAVSPLTSVIIAAPSEPARKTIRPESSIRRRPKRSPRLPASSSDPAKSTE